MVTLSVILFAIAAVLGLTVAVQIFKNKETNKIVVVIHGLAAAIALIILIVFFINNSESRVVASIVLFVLAAIGGAILVTRDFLRKTGPKALVVVHALAAVIAFIILLVFAFGR